MQDNAEGLAARQLFGGLTLAELEARETLSVGQASDLKIADGDGWRVWLSRVGVEDGAAFDNGVHVELLLHGGWIEVAQWQAPS